MPSLSLLSLDLRSSLDYRGIENPPLRGAPYAGSFALAGTVTLCAAPGPVPGSVPGGAAAAELAIGEGLAEGDEEIFVFDAEALVAFDPDEGPRAMRPLPAPGFYGRRKAGPAAGTAAGSAAGTAAGAREAVTCPSVAGEGTYSLARGTYLFLQFRPRDEAELAEGLEWFAREAWWEGAPGRGPYVVRRLREDEKLATQVLRRK